MRSPFGLDASAWASQADRRSPFGTRCAAPVAEALRKRGGSRLTKSTESDGGSGANGPVLVLHDDATTRELLAIALADAGYRCLGAANVPTAVAAARAHRPTLILAGTIPAGTLGRAFLAAYRHAPGPHAPVVLLTTDDDDVTTLAEPFDLDHLLAVVAGLAGRAFDGTR